mmetsp:Transcript_29581/g.87976  ORF Transcript_29581/g.87976 Transcript_29581/m.87976 type:complete len:303 (-) Transcript_29581:8-916(-)
MLTPAGGPVIVKTSPVVSMRAPVFSWMSLILEPLGPMTIPIFWSGTFTVAVEVLLLSAAAAAAAFSAAAWAAATAIAATCSFVAATAWEAAGPAFASGAGPMPGMYCGACPGFRPVAFASAFSASTRSLRFCCLFVRPVETSQSGPVPSSSWTNLSGLGSRFGGSSSTGFGAALALVLAAGFALPSAFAAGFAAAALAGAAFGSGLGSAFGSAAGSALAFALALALGSAAAGGAFAGAFAGAGAGGAASSLGSSAAAASLALFAACLRFALFERPCGCCSSAIVLLAVSARSVRERPGVGIP